MTTSQNTALAGDPPDDDSIFDLEPTQSLELASAGSFSTRAGGGVALVDGSWRSLRSETHDLRRNRLTSAALFMAVVSAVLLIWSFFNGTSMHWVITAMMGLRLVVAATVAGLLLSNLPISTDRVRLMEYGLFGLMAVLIAVTQYVVDVEFLRRGDVLSAATYMKNGVIGMIVLMVLYGTFIPNDTRTAATVILTMALVPIVSFALLMEAEHPDLVEELEGMRGGEHAGSNALSLMIGAGLAIYGAHILNGLRKDLHNARKYGQYQLGQQLGVGGMGEVYMAEHQLLKRPCALKLIKPGAVSDPIALARFEREVKSAARLSHPNTIAIYDYGHTDDGTFYYVMEYLPGLSLQDLVAQYGPMPPGRLIFLLRQVCAGLAEAHSLGIIHRDLKPANLFVALRGGEADVAKVLDFGLVKLTGDPDAPELTTDQTVSGTPTFMSPEQATGDSALDPRTDVYSLGAIAYFALTGQPPFKGSTPMAVMIAHARDPVVPPSQINESVPADLEQVVLRCLAKKPEDRYPNVKALSKDLAACQASHEWNEERAEEWWRKLVQPIPGPAEAAAEAAAVS
ncbi:MAG: serine/threonine-protein kinase [Paludisphaera borealis]|uniref:serine/threonine-protein kinase n=1 Tax=Paludisphaera borealis TaxID=1387353 RepID=UPI0028465D1E|nr:serine/threonine-protein kinase [Paludisphaera borealis]MDR3618619.1 serine/threonine-protein kinase [Paludisphaera borealis]